MSVCLTASIYLLQY